MVQFSRVWRAGLRMGHPQVRWLTPVMTHDGRMPAQFQRDREGFEALPQNAMECGKFFKILKTMTTPCSRPSTPLFLFAITGQFDKSGPSGNRGKQKGLQ